MRFGIRQGQTTASYASSYSALAKKFDEALRNSAQKTEQLSAVLGSAATGNPIAVIISVIETCQRLQIRPRDYFDAILPGLADFPVNRIAELPPTVWGPNLRIGV